MRTHGVASSPRIWGPLLLVLGMGAGGWLASERARADEGGAGEAAPEEGSCLACHGDQARAHGRFVDGPTFAASVHARLECAECHDGYEVHPHPAAAETVTCADCHEKEAEALAGGAHHGAVEGTKAGGRSPGCADCHGIHDVFRPSDRRSRLFPLNVPRTCGACHFEHGPTEAMSKEDLLAQRYTDDVHGHALLAAGLVVAPHCVTCHGGHDILPTKDPRARVHPDNVSQTCGTCHVGILEEYRTSIHGTTPRGHPENNVNLREPATCTDCHPPHQVRKTDTQFAIKTVDTCSGCHGDRGDTFRGTFHGRLTTLGFGGVATCKDCHTAHAILPASDPRSSVHPDNRRATCARCHEGATEAFAAYDPHANIHDRTAWPRVWWAERMLRLMLHVTWILGGLHMLLWIQRGLRSGGAFVHSPRPLAGRWYRRWRPTYRYLHLTLMFAFTLLALTGLPLHFAEAPGWRTLYAMLGGPDVMRSLHRVGGALTLAYFTAYFVHIGRRMAQGEKGLFHGPHTMLPRWKDVQDLTGHLRWFVRGGREPLFDRWAYWHKFYFWAEMWGVSVMALTGLVMWFPIQASHVMPGWMINVAHLVHAHEAVLATTVIFVLHTFHMNLRPGKFPMDPVVFTGRISEETLRTQHPLEYERMRLDGRLESEALPPPDERALRRAYRIGGTMIAIAFILLALMVSTLFVA